MKIHTVEHARKSPGSCSTCGKPIEVGDPYKWGQNFRASKVVKCGTCQFRNSDMTQSKLAGFYAAQEQAEDAIEAWDPANGKDSLESDLSSAADDAEAVAEEYREAVSGWEHETSTTAEWEEKAEAIDEWCTNVREALDSVEDFDLDAKRIEAIGEVLDIDAENYEALTAEQQAEVDEWIDTAIDEWADEVREAATDVVSEFSL